MAETPTDITPAAPAPVALPKYTGPAPRSNIYTVLSVVAVTALLAGIVFVWVVNAKMTGSFNPLALVGK